MNLVPGDLRSEVVQVLSLGVDDAIQGMDLPIASEDDVVSTFELFGKHFFHSSCAIIEFLIHQ